MDHRQEEEEILARERNARMIRQRGDDRMSQEVGRGSALEEEREQLQARERDVERSQHNGGRGRPKEARPTR